MKFLYDGKKTVVSGRELIHECRELLELNHRDQELALVKILTNNITVLICFPNNYFNMLTRYQNIMAFPP